jgi:hypothetical protein
MKPMELLTAIIDNLTMPKNKNGEKRRFVFDTPEQEERFKHLLSQVPKKAEIIKAGNVYMMLVRPENVGKFGELVKENGLSSCTALIDEIAYLQTWPAAKFKIEIVRP